MPQLKTRPAAVFFDLDGTLVDTADDQGLQLAGCGFLDHLLGVEASLGQLAPSQGLCPGLVNAAAEGKQTREEASLDGGAVAGAARDPREAGTRTLSESNDGRQKARRLCSALAHEDDAAGQRLSHVGVGTARLNRVHDARLSAGGGVQEASIHLARAVGGEGRNRGDLEARLAHGLAQAQEHGTALVLGLEGAARQAHADIVGLDQQGDEAVHEERHEERDPDEDGDAHRAVLIR